MFIGRRVLSSKHSHGEGTPLLPATPAHESPVRAPWPLSNTMAFSCPSSAMSHPAHRKFPDLVALSSYLPAFAGPPTTLHPLCPPGKGSCVFEGPERALLPPYNFLHSPDHGPHTLDIPSPECWTFSRDCCGYSCQLPSILFQGGFR